MSTLVNAYKRLQQLVTACNVYLQLFMKNIKSAIACHGLLMQGTTFNECNHLMPKSIKFYGKCTHVFKCDFSFPLRPLPE